MFELSRFRAQAEAREADLTVERAPDRRAIEWPCLGHYQIHRMDKKELSERDIVPSSSLRPFVMPDGTR
jgi:hypothetical protein